MQIITIKGIKKITTDNDERPREEKLRLLTEINNYYPNARVGLLTYAAGLSNRITADYLNEYTDFNLAYLKRYGYLEYTFEDGYYVITASERNIFNTIEKFLADRSNK